MKKLLVLLALCVICGCAVSTQLLVNKKTVIYLVGDSTCAPRPESARPKYGWGEKFEELLDGYKVVNKAVGGRSTKNYLSEGRWAKILEVLKAGDVVLIQFGHNDEKLSDPTRGTQPFGEYYDNLCRYVSETRAKGAIPVLLTPVCRRSYSSNGEVKRSHKDYPAAVIKAGKDTKTVVLDIEQMSFEWLGKLGKDESFKRFYICFDGKDNTHFVELGAKEVAEMVASAMKKSGDKNLSALVTLRE